MADLTHDESHIMRKMISNEWDHCCACAQFPEPVLRKLCERGWMEYKGHSVYRLTVAGKGITLRDLRGD